MKHFAISRGSAFEKAGVRGPFEDSAAAVRDSFKAYGDEWQRYRIVVSSEDLAIIRQQAQSLESRSIGADGIEHDRLGQGLT